MALRLFVVSKAWYVIGDNATEIAGVPEQDMLYFGEYTGKYPYQAASKAFTGLQKHMKKFYRTGNWFPGYKPNDPPEIIFELVDMDTMESAYYRGNRVPAHQGPREIINMTDGRIRRYKWDNKIEKISAEG